jgi:tetratricopeptide (TPR) repeat protein
MTLIAVASAGCSKQGDSKDTYLMRAAVYFTADQYQQAEREYREALRLDPANPVAVRQLGLIYQSQGQLLQAYPFLKRAADWYPGDWEVQLGLAQTLLALRQRDQARAVALHILANQPKDQQAVLLLAETVATPEENDEVRKRIESLQKQDRERAGYHVALGVLAARQNDEARAETEFKTALDLDPNSADAHLGLALLHWTRKDLNGAGEEFKTAADLCAPRSPLRLRYVDFLIKTGSRSEAKAILEEITRKTADYLPARIVLMKLACAEHRDDDCAGRVQDIIAQDPSNYDALLQQGLVSLTKGDAVSAIREFDSLGHTYTRDAVVHYQLARAYLLSAQTATGSENTALAAAENALTDAIKLDPRFEQAIVTLAELKIKIGTPAAAVDLLTPLVKEAPQLAVAQYLLASAYVAQQNVPQALATFQRMTELFPQDPQPYFLLGTTLRNQRQLPEARKAFEKAVEISPNFLPAIEQLVDLDLAEKQFTMAMERVQSLLDKDDKAAQAWALKGKIHFGQHEFADAEASLSKAIQLAPNFEPAYILLAQLHVASGRPEQAIDELSRFVEDHKDMPALMLLALIQQNQRQFAAARDAYEKALAINPNAALALNNLAVLESEYLGDLDGAERRAKKAVELAPNEPVVLDTLAWILFKKGDYPTALRLEQDSANKLPQSPEIQYHLGMAHYMLGDDAPARVALQKAVDSTVDFSSKDDAGKRLAILAIDPATADASAARPPLEAYLQSQPNDPAALTRLAAFQRRAGAADGAREIYEKVITDYPSYGPALRQLAFLYGQQDNAKAYELTARARQVYPDDAELAKLFGILSYRRNLLPQSAELLQQAAAKRQDDAELLFYLGEAYHGLKQWSDCKKTLQQAIGLNLSTELADTAKKSLADCSGAAH